MAPKITVQLYSVRDNLGEDFAGTMKAIADMGYKNVEFAGEPSDEAIATFKDLGLSTPTCHWGLPVGDDKNRLIEKAQSLGVKYLGTGCSPKFKEDFVSIDAIKACAEQYAEAAEFAAGYGIQVAYHNHDWEMAILDGRPACDYFFDNTPESVLWQADLYWVKHGGQNEVDFMKKIGVRGKALHFKDGDTSTRGAFKPAGTGDVDLKGAAAAASSAEYIAVELDQYDGNMMEAVKQSFDYLTGEGIAEA